MDEFRPLLYFLKECEHIRDLYFDEEFLNEDDAKIFKNVIQVPRTSEWIWIYQKLTEKCNEVNREMYNFQISGFNCDLHSSEDYASWNLTLNKGQRSTNKINVILCTGKVTVYMNHGEYEFEGKIGTILIFPSFLWWKASGEYLMCTLSGNHFM